jgi:hypothetical protein
MDKVRVIAVNTQPCYQFNFFVWSSRYDPGGELAWLEALLRDMESKGEIAIFLGHVPPGSVSCLYDWAIRLRAILDRYQHIVRWSVFGHVHEETFGTERAIGSGKAVGVQHWSGSVSTYAAVNPSFRVLEVDEETLLPVRIETHVFDVTQN